MPKVAKGRRKRAYRPKTRSGCLTCKVRRVKCDEARPECLRCTSTRRVCDGYSHDPSPDSSSLIRIPMAVTTGQFDGIHACSQSRRSFAFFTQRTSPQLAGFFGSVFWERLVLQAAHHEPAIQHAIVAIGSLHEQKTMAGDIGPDFALEQYNLSIRHLLAPLSKGEEQGVDVCLISCILFTCFENMQGRHSLAETHIRSGSKLLQEAVNNQRRATLHHSAVGFQRQASYYVPLEVLATIFAGLDTQAATVMRDYQSETYREYFTGVMDSNKPFIFSDIQEAKHVFEYGRSLFTSSHPAQMPSGGVDPPSTFRDQLGYFTTLMSKFSQGLQAFADTRGPLLTPQEETAVATLQLHVLDTYVSFNIEHLPVEYRPHRSELLPQMKEMVVLGEKIISSISPCNDHRHQTVSYCLDMGLVIPLYTVASQCHDKTTRRRAIDLLRSTSRQEGLWNSLVVAKAAERILDIEEGEGVQLTAWANDTVWSSVPPTILQLDAAGVRLQYVRPGRLADTHVNVVEEVFVSADRGGG